MVRVCYRREATSQYTDFAILFAVPDEQICTIESLLTVTGGDAVYAAGPFADVAPDTRPAISPAWSPIAVFGGYQRSRQRVSSESIRRYNPHHRRGFGVGERAAADARGRGRR
jgi:hypothetical protein